MEIYDSIVYKMPEKAQVKKIESIVSAFDNVKECHRIRVRKLGHYLFIDMHVLVSENTPLYDAHKLTEDIENTLKREIPNVADVVIHLEPFEHESLMIVKDGDKA